MQKTYTYDPRKYKVHIVFIGYLMILFAVGFAVKIILDPKINFYLFGLVLSVYGAANTFIFKSNPRDIIVDDETISFVSTGIGEAKYEIRRLTNFQIKESANAQFYVRVTQDDGKKGRYWVSYYYFSDKEDLINELYYIENKVHPGNLKFIGRKKQFAYRPGQEPEGWDKSAEDDK